jgi:hypothetical protein
MGINDESEPSGTTTTGVPTWCEDEARLGLKPIVRKVWTLRGQRPLAGNHTRYEWLYVYGFVRPATGQSYWLVVPTVTTAVMSLGVFA